MKKYWASLIAAAALGASGCSSMPPGSTPPAAASSASPFAREGSGAKTEVSVGPGAAKGRETVATAAEHLAAGREAEAKAILQAIVMGTPRDAAAQAFLRQIETDPIKLLGAPSANSYVVQAGDTMSGLAERFLGDSRLFYALSRYNGLPAPNALAVGRVLKLPASAKADAAISPLNSPQATASKGADPARANAIRLEALQLLNTGNVPRAVDLLKEAVTLDPTDSVIRKDLERAERIHDTLSKG